MDDEQLAARRAGIPVHCAACGGEFPGTTELHNGICDACQKLTHGPNYRLIAELNRKSDESARHLIAAEQYHAVSQGLRAEVGRLREAIRAHRDRVVRAQEEHGPPINALDVIDTDLWGALDE